MTPELHAVLFARYLRHTFEAERTSFGLHVWHVAAARGLYRYLADVELAGGPPAPMGMPHVLCVSDRALQVARS